MLSIIKKEWQQYFSGMLGYLIIIVFLLISGLVVFILPDSSILDGGYATLEPLFFHCTLCHAVSDSGGNHEKFQ